MDTQRRPKLEITDRQGNRIVSENSAGTAIAPLRGVPLGANRGTSLNLGWEGRGSGNLSGGERREGATGVWRTGSKDWETSSAVFAGVSAWHAAPGRAR